MEEALGGVHLHGEKSPVALKTLLFSGQVKGKELAESARSRGFNFELIEKPLHPQELLQKIKNWGLE